MEKAIIKAYARADNAALMISHYLGVFEAERNREADNWGDVGTLNHLADKLAEIQKEIESYVNNRTIN